MYFKFLASGEIRFKILTIEIDRLNNTRDY